MIKLGSFFPEALNLNGDQGNLLALKKYLEAAGFQVAVESIGAANSYDEIHFALLGHGSMAAMRSLNTAMSAVAFDQLLSKTPGLAIGSGFEYLAGLGLTKSTIEPGERDSEFAVGELGSIAAIGYRNTDSGLPNLELNGNWICSMLHGPLLAKNPVLLDRAAKAAVAAAGLVWPAVAPEPLTNWVSQLNRVSAQIWALETEAEFKPLVLG
jgi:CobQ-like glutamine amidotransferase family enzyme